MSPAAPLFFDLDGPLLDVRARYHGVYAAIAAELAVPALGLDEYWVAKRRQAPLATFFPGAADQARLREQYLARWLAWIEAPEWLRRDTLVPGARECLEALGRSGPLYLVTLRRQPLALETQLEALGLRSYFRGVFSGWVDADEAPRLKASWMRPLAVPGSSVIVGDSEVDMQAAALLGIRRVAVAYGIREPLLLQESGAEEIIHCLTELVPRLARG